MIATGLLASMYPGSLPVPLAYSKNPSKPPLFCHAVGTYNKVDVNCINLSPVNPHRYTAAFCESALNISFALGFFGFFFVPLKSTSIFRRILACLV